MYEGYTFETLRDSMLNNVPDKFDKREGSIIYSTLAPVAMALSLLYKQLETAENNCYPDTADMKALVEIAKPFGITPKPATNAELLAEFFPINIDIVGKRFTCDALSYVVVECNKNGEAVVKCEQTGTVGNTYQNKPLLPVDYVQGLTEAKLKELSVPAEDEETMEAFRERVLNSSRCFSGNIADYKRIALDVSGVSGVKVIPASGDDWGVVKLYVQGENFAPASDLIVANVKSCFLGDAYANGFIPIGHTLEVYPAEAVFIPVSFELILESGFYHEDIMPLVEEKVKSYFHELRAQWGKQSDSESITICSSRLYYDALSVKGVKDTTVHIGQEAVTGNYQLPPLQIPFIYGESYD